MKNLIRLPVLPLLGFLATGVLAALTTLAVTAPSDAQAFCNYQNVPPKTIGRKEARKSIICLINDKRRKHGRGSYSSNSRLVDSAVKHSGTMARKNCLSHQCSGEGSLLTRIRNAGYIHGGLSRWAYGENVAARADHGGTPGKIVDSWMNSSAHRSAILSGTFEDVGIGFQNRGDKGFYTADFGMRRG